MADLTYIEKLALEEALGLKGGYVLNFSDSQLADFFRATLGIEILSDKYGPRGTSKANRFRTFYENESNEDVAKILSEVLNFLKYKGYDTNHKDFMPLKSIVSRLQPQFDCNQIDVSNIWEDDKIRLFISHRDNIKKEVKWLASDLDLLGVSSFVAHDSIQPMSTWKDEIYKALLTMEGFVCFITHDYYGSVWTNQEIGFALSKGVPIFVYSHDGTDPQGFRSDIQAIKTGPSTLKFHIKQAYSNRHELKRHIIQAFINAKDGSFAGSKERFQDLLDLTLTDSEIDSIVEAIHAPAKHINQHLCLLTDKVEFRHSKYAKGTPLTELLDRAILSQHSKSRYSVRVDSENRRHIVDHQLNTSVPTEQ